MTITRQTYTGDGSTVLFTFAFPYVVPSDVVVEVNSTITPQNSINYPWSFANSNTIQFVTAPPTGINIEIYRDTNLDEVVYAFYPGSSIRAKDLNENFDQILYVAQESRVLIEQADAGTVSAIANQALSTANQAEFTANSISGTAQSALTTSQNAETTAQNAETIAQDAETVANALVNTAKIEDYAVTTAKIADDAVTADKVSPGLLLPTGAITAFGGSTAPTGYLECNGQTTSGYAALAAVVGANVPDLRGEFIRGWNNGRGVDPGRSILSAQTEDYLRHNHSSTSVSNHTHSINNAGNHNHSMGSAGNHRHSYTYRRERGDGDTDGGTDIADDGTQTGNTGYAGNHSHSINSNGSHNHSMANAGAHNHTIGNSGGAETRPRNVALMYIIKT